MAKSNQKLGLVSLTAIVFGSMIGSGIFNIVQNMSDGASVGAVIISWLITAFGILFLVLTFKSLADLRPDLNAGIYQYAQRGFGDYVGFNMAWGYWLCTSFANVAYAVMLNDSLGVFFPELLHNRWLSLAFGSCLIWTMYFIVIRGIRSASLINTVITLLKIMSIVLIVLIIVLFFKMDMFTQDFWGQMSDLGGVGTQVRRTMLVTLWCFIGIEGAAMMSARAKRAADVGRASIMGFMLAWVLYTFVSVLSFGVMSQAQMSQLGNPSVAYLLKDICGEWAYYFVIISVIFALFGGWIAWTLICAQVPYEAAEQRIMPRQFMSVNHHGVPSFGLFIASLIMQLFYIGVLTTESVYMAAIEISGMMVLPAYLFSGIFLCKGSFLDHRYLHLSAQTNTFRYKVIGLICTIYCLWLIYAGGIRMLLLSTLLYIPGTAFYIMARRQYEPTKVLNIVAYFCTRDRVIFITLCLCGILALIIK